MNQTLHSQKEAPAVRRYRIIAGTTVGAVIFLILVGAVVRMTGSGMGCPDWPTCFGQWVPPTDISQLPADYKTRFAVAGKEIADFDAFKTWVEYINRLLGVLIGFFSLATLLAAIPLRKSHPWAFGMSVLGFVAVLIVGGVGAYVVRTDLQEGVVTIHMILALSALAFFILGLWHSVGTKVSRESLMRVPGREAFILAVLFGVMVFGQIVMGTQVREEIDLIAKSLGAENRVNWIGELSATYDIHRFFYYALLGVLLFIGIRLRPVLNDWIQLRNVYVGIWLAIGGEVLLGLGMHHLGIPAWMQPAHLLLATLVFAGALSLLILLWMGNRLAKTPNVVLSHD